MQGPAIPMQLSTLTVVISVCLSDPDPPMINGLIVKEDSPQVHVSARCMFMECNNDYSYLYIFCVPFGVISANSGGSTVLLNSSKL